jgi:hypothetical protein
MAPAFDVLLVLLIALAVLGVAYVVHRLVLGGAELRKLSGKMLVTCPETHKTVAVKVATAKAAWAEIAGKQHVELSNCTRWPERQDCDQACLSELLSDPEKHSVWMICLEMVSGENLFLLRASHFRVEPFGPQPRRDQFRGKDYRVEPTAAGRAPRATRLGSPSLLELHDHRIISQGASGTGD